MSRSATVASTVILAMTPLVPLAGGVVTDRLAAAARPDPTTTPKVPPIPRQGPESEPRTLTQVGAALREDARRAGRRCPS
jgi:hypothetical protein